LSPIYIRPMQREDVPQVDLIAKAAFPEDFPPPSFKSLLNKRERHWFFVACERQESGEPASAPKQGTASTDSHGPLSWLRGLLGMKPPADGTGQESVVGYVGFQMLDSRAHIVDVAVRPEYRRRGLGELLVIVTIQQAMELDAAVVSLEVRVSNKPAQALYEKYGFTKMEVRREYYFNRSGGKEDGYYMVTERLNSTPFQTLFRELKQAHEERWGAFALLKRPLG
jgi:ribosomal-protein-alanine N-acetyltransferase